MTMESQLNRFQVNPENERKIDALLAQMTLDEKTGQMNQRGSLKDTDIQMIREGKIGSFLNLRGADHVNELQRIAIEESRLGIPLIIGDDVIHGYRTTFPIPLAEACSWNLSLMEETAAIAALEASTEGIHWIFAPMVDICRDPRWGRIAEGAGEDTYLGSQIARARVAGIQRNGWTDRPWITACPKHFAAYGIAEAGRDYNTVDASEARLREMYFPPFQHALDAGAGTIMSAFNDLNGVPCTGNRWLLRDVLQKEWAFPGFVVSDWESIDELVQHGYTPTREDAALRAAVAGVHMDMHARVYSENVSALIERGVLSVEVINDAVRRILRVKFALGLFDRPYTDPQLIDSIMMNPSHVETAREMARQSIVLLKNENRLLPMSKSVRKLAVIGPLADRRDALLGCWAGQGRSEDAVSVLQGIQEALSEEADILYAKGCDIWEGSDAELAEAEQTAKQADIAVVVVGETADMSGENNSRVSLDLTDPQQKLLEAVYATGVPVVVVLINGRPLSIPWLKDHVPAIVEAWHPGIQGGAAVADVLFGDVNPSGKLVVTIPRTVGQVPISYNMKKTGRPQMRRYADCEYTPLYPFGYGLSYTEYEYSDLSLTKERISIRESAAVSVRVSNKGDRDGEEIVQLYICDEFASLTRPVKELKGFKKINLKAGESKTVTFTLDDESLGFISPEGKRIVEPGYFTLWIGPHSEEGLEGRLEVY
ncbi:beta-glucosidase BglX [Paenibacillus marinisediminis]